MRRTKKLVIAILFVILVGLVANYAGTYIYHVGTSQGELAQGDKNILICAIDESEKRPGMGACDMAFIVHLHNGSFVTSYNQKVICSIAKVVFNIVHKVLTIGAFLLPIISAISRLVNGGFSSNGWGKIIFGILGLIACVIAGFVSFGAFSGKRKFTFERIFYEPKTIV